MGEIPQPQLWTVTEITKRIQDIITAEPTLQSIAIQGEISNYKRYSSGHSYFTLKDQTARLRCVLFRSQGIHLSFMPQDGQEVIAIGRIGVYPTAGDYQLYVQHLIPGGQGALHYAKQRSIEQSCALCKKTSFNEICR
jgi:exodeoxyribonuclease VII large subunit